MTMLIIQSNSEKKTELLVQLAEELGLTVKAEEFRELTTHDVAFGIGRKATDEELMAYLSKDGGTPMKLQEAFEKYLSQK